MRSKRWVLGLGAVALGVALAGCAPVYDKPGVADDQRRRDEAACMRVSVERIPGGLMGDHHFSAERIDRACMERRGYRLK
jgi:hypothetical protein